MANENGRGRALTGGRYSRTMTGLSASVLRKLKRRCSVTIFVPRNWYVPMSTEMASSCWARSCVEGRAGSANRHERR